jgi:hypothetical protein
MATAAERLRLIAQAEEEERRKRMRGDAPSHSIEPRDIRRADEPVPPEPLPEEFGWVEDMDTSADVDPVPSVPEDALTDLGKEVRGEMRPPEKVKGSREVGEASVFDELEQSDIEMEALDRQATADKELDEYNAGEPARTEENAAEQKTHEERLSGALAKAEETRSDAPLMEGGIAASVIERDAPHVKELERREERLRQLGSGMSQGDIAAANNPMLQQAIADKAAREAAKPSIDEKAGIANKKALAMDEAMREAGHEVDRKISPTFINPDTGKEEGGAHYAPSTHDVINAYDDEGNIVGQKVVRKKDAPEDPDKPSPEEMKRRRDVYANKIREDAVAQKAERKRQGMLLRGDTHALGELDRQTAEDAATRLRDAEAAIRADETLTANEQAIKIQELKNTGVTDVAQIGADAQTGVATIHGETAMGVGQQAGEFAAASQESQQAHQVQTAEILAETNAAAQNAEIAHEQATQAVQNAHDAASQDSAQAHLQTTQANLIDAQAAQQQAQNAHNASMQTSAQGHEAGMQQTQIDADAASQTSAQDHATGSQTSVQDHEARMQSEELTLAREAMNNQNDDKVRQDAIDKNNREIADLEMAIASGTLNDQQQTEAEDRVSALRGIAPSTSLDPEHAEVSLERTNPELFTKLTELTADYIEDSDGEWWIGDTIWEGIQGALGGEVNITDRGNLEYFAEHLKTLVDQKKITPVNIKTVSAIILGRMDGKVREALGQMEEGFDMPVGDVNAEYRKAFNIITAVLQGNMPTP